MSTLLNLLLNLEKSDKKAYGLASHSHFFMLNIFNTKHWRDDEAYCPAGSLGLPAPNAIRCSRSPIGQSRRPRFTGHMLGRVYPDGTIDSEFTERKTSDIPAAKSAIANSGSWPNQACLNENRITTPRPQPDYCKETLAKAQLGLTKDQPKLGFNPWRELENASDLLGVWFFSRACAALAFLLRLAFR